MSECASGDDAPALPVVRPIFKSREHEAQWEQKQRNREYRAAARREKRNQTSDEKKQRDLSAALLRLMTKSPDKCNRNIDRNRRSVVELERWHIFREAVARAERLQPAHDPNGKMFNVGPVVVLDNKKVDSVDVLGRRATLQTERAASPSIISSNGKTNSTPNHTSMADPMDGIHPERRKLICDSLAPRTKHLIRGPQKKPSSLEKRPPPPEPVIPEGIEIPAGEKNWPSLWDLSGGEIEHRVVREKSQKTAERKALRQKEKAGKAERKAVRNERRKVYREKRLEWQAIKEMDKQQNMKILKVEQEEFKRINDEINLAERHRALEICQELGFTLSNVEGVHEFDIIEIRSQSSAPKIKDEKVTKNLTAQTVKSNRVGLDKAANESTAEILTSGGTMSTELVGFVSLNFKYRKLGGNQFGSLRYNHQPGRKLHKAAQIKKELLVRAAAKKYCESNSIEVPSELATKYKPVKRMGRRILEDGTLETEKQAHIIKRLELAEYKEVLRKQAKAEANEAGLRLFAKLTSEKLVNQQRAFHTECTIKLNTTNPIKAGEHKDPCGQKKRRRGSDANYNPTKMLKSSVY